MQTLRTIILSITLCMTSLTQANELSVFDNQYSARLYGFNIDVTSRLTARGGNNYEFYFSAHALLGEITEVSQFKWDAQSQYVVPQTYNYNRSGLGKSKKQDLQFDRQKKIVLNKTSNTTSALDISKQIQDNLSYQVQLRQDLIAGKKNVTYFISDGKKTRDYHFAVVAEEVLDTPLGKVNTVKVRRSDTKSKREVSAWFAKDFQYLLVRLEQEENGSAYTIYISKASLNGKAIAHF
jgi:Protein of unknown function (DUF3108)